MMKKLNDVVDSYFAQKKELHAAFGYDPNLAEESPLEDQRRMHWMLVELEKNSTWSHRSPRPPFPDLETGSAWSQRPVPDRRGICVFSTEPFTKDSVASGKILFGGPVGSSVLRTETHVLVGIVPRMGFEPKTGLAIRYSTVRGQVLTIFDAALECKDPAVAEEYVKRWGRQ